LAVETRFVDQGVLIQGTKTILRYFSASGSRKPNWTFRYGETGLEISQLRAKISKSKEFIEASRL
jgi:hypothetical protein